MDMLGRKLILKGGNAIYLMVMWQTRHSLVWPWATWPSHTTRFDCLLSLTALLTYWSPPWQRSLCVSAGELTTLYTWLGWVLPKDLCLYVMRQCHMLLTECLAQFGSDLSTIFIYTHSFMKGRKGTRLWWPVKIKALRIRSVTRA